MESKKQPPNGHPLPGHLSPEDLALELEAPLSTQSKVAIDIGGTLAKVVTYNPSTRTLDFAKFQTDDVEGWLGHLKQALAQFPGDLDSPIAATGGGAHRFYNRLCEAVEPRKVLQRDEMDSLIWGVDYFITKTDKEVFHYNSDEPGYKQFTSDQDQPYPYMLVNIGSGVSLIVVNGPGDYRRVSGTSLGGGTFWGLASLLAGPRTFDEMLELSQQGTNKHVDLLVGDIYGSTYGKIGLKASAIASSMGKVYRSLPKETTSPQPQDLVASLLYMVSNNIGQIAYLNAQAHQVHHIYFGGFFIRGHPVTMHTLDYAINFWSQGKDKPRFLRHEGYLGAMGALLNSSTQN